MARGVTGGQLSWGQDVAAEQPDVIQAADAVEVEVVGVRADRAQLGQPAEHLAGSAGSRPAAAQIRRKLVGAEKGWPAVDLLPQSGAS